MRRLIRDLEGEAPAADANDVAVVQTAVEYPTAIDENAITRPDIDEPIFATARTQLAVATRDVAVAQADIAAGCAADDNDSAKRKHVATIERHQPVSAPRHRWGET